MFICFLQVTKSKQELAFYSIPEFDEWKKQTENYKTWHIKYYKGLLLKFLNMFLQFICQLLFGLILKMFNSCSRFGYKYKQRGKGILC